jgi:hypothetical protein
MNLTRLIASGLCAVVLGVAVDKVEADAEHTGQQVDYMDALAAFELVNGCVSTHVDAIVGSSYTHNNGGAPVSDDVAYFNVLVTDRCTPGSIKRYGTTLTIPYYENDAELSRKLEGATVTFDAVAPGGECTQVGFQFSCVERSFTVALSVDWEPAGDIVTTEGQSHDRADGYVGHSHFLLSERPALATLIGSIDGVPLELTDSSARLSYSKFTAQYVTQTPH